MERDGFRRAEALHTFGDHLVLGRALTAPDAIPGDATDLVECLQALGEPPALDSARERVWRDLQQHRRWKEPDVTTHSRSLNGTAGSAVIPGQRRWAPQSSAPPARPPVPMRWAPSRLATAVLVLLMVAGSMLVFGSGRLRRQDGIPFFLSAISGTPAAKAVVTEPLVS